MRQIYKYNEEQYSNETPEFMYLLGLIASDGVLEKYHIKITLQSMDLKLLESIRDSVVPNKPLYYNKRDDTYVLKISNKKIMDAVRSYGITERKSLTLNLSEKILNSAFFPHFLRGYFDGDGTVTENGTLGNKHVCIKIVSGSRQVIESIINKLSQDYKMNKNSVIVEKSSFNGYSINNQYYMMQYTCGQAKKFFDVIYKDANFYMERKYNKFLEKLTNIG